MNSRLKLILIFEILAVVSLFAGAYLFDFRIVRISKEEVFFLPFMFILAAGYLLITHKEKSK